MYVGLAAVYLGGTLLLNDAWPIALFPVVIALVRRRVIAREEAYLERKFGDEYRAYKARVRRWI
jgi:protein-S-isoprenylcysteine O-methyltransferase Ste14